MILPGMRLLRESLNPRCQALMDQGFSFRVDDGKRQGRDGQTVFRCAQLIICYGAEDVVSRIFFGMFTNNELFNVIEVACDLHRWCGTTHPVLERLAKQA